MSSRKRLLRLRRPLLLIALGVLLSFGLYMLYLDRLVVKQFEGKRFALPARVYAAPLELYEGKPLPIEALEEALVRLNYNAADRIEGAGQYRSQRNQIELFTRPFTFWDGPQTAQHLTISFLGNKIHNIVSVPQKNKIHLLRLEPHPIGGIYPNKGEDRVLVRLEQVPRHLIDTLIAVEDRRFYQHIGIDPIGIMRAISTVFTGKRIQGGSTITQQLVKNFYLTQTRTLRRKVKEMLMALLLEIRYEKDDILETYMNEVYFGQDKNRAIHGFALASQFYFSRSIEHIDYHQSALLVGLLKGPTYYNPRRHPERAKKRVNVVLRAVADQNLITQEELDELINTQLILAEKPNLGQSPYPAFMDLVIRQLRRDYREKDLRSEGLKIFTTLNTRTQRVAEKSVVLRLNTLEKEQALPLGHLQSAYIIANIMSGEIEALVGGRTAGYQGFNRALNASRQVGSLIKPAIYLTALKDKTHFHLASPLDDSEFVWQEPGIEDWQPKNYDGEFHGQVPMWEALAKSYNVAAARLGTQLGVAEVMESVKQLGIHKELPNYASGLLGTIHLTPYEVLQMYHTIANSGFYSPLRAIREVTSADGEPLKRYPLQVKASIDPSTNFLLVNGLQQVVQRGTGISLNRYLDKSINAAGKTGTTDALRDSWYAGFTGDRVAVAWIGNDTNQSILLTGASGALSIWGLVMQALSPTALEPKQPEDIVLAGVSRETGWLTDKDCNNTIALPFNIASLPENSNYCGAKGQGKLKSWLKSIFNRDE